MATITFQSWTYEAGSPVANPTGSIRFHNGGDNFTDGTNVNPLIRPVTAVGNETNWSYNKFIDVEVTDGGWLTISNPTIAASNTGSLGELNTAGETPAKVFLYSAFHQEVGANQFPSNLDFGEVTDGSGSATGNDNATIITGAWAAWNLGASMGYGGVTTFSATGSNQLFSQVSSNQSEFLALSLKLTADVQTGGSLETFTITLTYSEI